MPRAETLKEAYNNLYIEPLKEPHEFQDFYVERPVNSTSPIIDLKDSIEISDRKSKYLFLGFRGSGKSTELNRLSKSLDSSRFLVVLYSIRDELDMSDFDFRDFFVSMALKIYDAAIQEGICLHPDIETELNDFIKRITKIEDDEISRNASAGVSLPYLINIKMGMETKTRQTMREELSQRISDLIQILNDLINDTEGQSRKRIVVIVDDLDKLTRGQQSEEFFYKNYQLLILPNCFIIYTFPIPLVFHPQYANVRHSFTDEVIMLQLPVKDRYGNVIQENLNFYQEVISKRMDPTLFENGVLTEAIESTGKLSELIEVVRDATLKAFRSPRDRISSEDLQGALDKLRMIYDRTLSEAHKRELLEIHKNKEARDDDPNSVIIRDLLFSLSAVEYKDHEGRWCAIDPLLVPLVEKWTRSTQKT